MAKPTTKSGTTGIARQSTATATGATSGNKYPGL